MFTDETSELFCELELADALRIQARKTKGHVYSIGTEEFRSRPNESLVEGVLKNLDIQQLIFHTDRRDTDTEMIMLSRSEPGYRITVSIPYTGERRLWFFQPQDHNQSFPRGQINASGPLAGGVCKLIAQRSSHLDLEPLNQAIEREVGEIDRFIRQQRKEIGAWRIELAAAIRKEVAERRSALGEEAGDPEALALNTETVQPESPSEQASQTEMPDKVPAGESRSIIAAKPSSQEVRASASPAAATPSQIVESESRIIERLSQIYSPHSDEELRNILLAHLTPLGPDSVLDGQYERSGKTNFLRSTPNGAKPSTFVGGCMTWKGPAALKKKCEQLLSRAGGRGATVALVVLFRRSEDFSRVVEKVPQTLRKHAHFKSEVKDAGAEASWTFLMSSPSGDKSKIKLRAISVNLPPAEG